MQTIDMTPTWGEIGNIYARLAASGETKALAGMRSEAARAFSAAQALQAIQSRLPADLLEEVCRVMDAEMTKQGFPASQRTKASATVQDEAGISVTETR